MVESTLPALWEMESSPRVRGNAPELRKHFERPLYVPETLTGMELLDNFRSMDVHMALVTPVNTPERFVARSAALERRHAHSIS